LLLLYESVELCVINGVVLSDNDCVVIMDEEKESMAWRKEKKDYFTLEVLNK
jgi:hypothetical protein